jgi:flagellar biosynthesis protein FlhG
MTITTSPLRLPTGIAGDRRIVAVASGKGGVGKTWLAITLAHVLARQGKRTLLFDADLGLANVDIQLGLVPKVDLHGVLVGKLSLKQAVTPYPDGGFDIIAGRSGSGSLASLPPQRLDSLTNRIIALASGYDHVILDLAAGIESVVRFMTRPAAQALVITTEEPTSLTDAYAFIKLTSRDFPSTDLRVVVNMASSQQAGQRTYSTLAKACQNFLQFSPPLAAIIRRDDKVPDAIRHQTPLLIRHPGAKAAADVEALAAGLKKTP